MGTLSSLTGAGSGGGGGDPQATFQASANVANGDLVVLNDNGTVAPVTLQSFSSDLSTSSSITNIYGGNATRYSNGGHFAGYNETNNQYVITASSNNNSTYLYRASFNSSTGAFTLHNFAGRSSVYATMLAQDYNTYDNFYFVSRNSAGNLELETIYWDGTNYRNGNGYGVGGSVSTKSNCAYVGVNDDGTVIVASGSNSGNRIGVGSATPNGNGSGTLTVNYNVTAREAGAGDMNYTIDDGGFHGAHCGGNVHAILHRNGNDGMNLWLMPINADANGVTWGTPVYTGLPSSGNYLDVCYDPVGNVGLILYGNAIKGFTVDKTNLTASFFSVTTNGSPQSSGGIGFNRSAGLFHYLAGTSAGGIGKTVETFTLTSDGTQGTITEYILDASNANGSWAAEFPTFHNFQNTGLIGLTFNNNQNNQQYITTMTPAYSTTNMDSHFGEAKDAITSGSAGPVAMFNRDLTIANAGFTKGQKLYANSSGTSLATSGTYRVGYAKDSDTVLILGDPS